MNIRTCCVVTVDTYIGSICDVIQKLGSHSYQPYCNLCMEVDVGQGIICSNQTLWKWWRGSCVRSLLRVKRFNRSMPGF